MLLQLEVSGHSALLLAKPPPWLQSLTKEAVRLQILQQLGLLATSNTALNRYKSSKRSVTIYPSNIKQAKQVHLRVPQSLVEN